MASHQPICVSTTKIRPALYSTFPTIKRAVVVDPEKSDGVYENISPRQDFQHDFIKQSAWSKTYRQIFRETSEGPNSPDSLISAKDEYEKSATNGDGVQYLRRTKEFGSEPALAQDQEKSATQVHTVHSGTRYFPIQSTVRPKVEKGFSLPARRPSGVVEFSSESPPGQNHRQRYIRKTQSTAGTRSKSTGRNLKPQGEGLLMPKAVETNRNHSFAETTNGFLHKEHSPQNPKPRETTHFPVTSPSQSQVSVVSSALGTADVRKAMGSLQVNDDMLGILNKFVKNHFDATNVKITETSETSMPLQYYLSRIVNLTDGHKNASMEIKQLMTLSSEEFKPLIKENGTIEKKHHRNVCSPKSPVYGPERDLLDIVMVKIDQKIPLDWPELFLLKNAHCRLVIPKERQLTKQKNLSKDSSAWKLLEAEIAEDYRNYQVIIEQITIVDNLYTKLAFDIMQAEAYWYAARVVSESILRSNNYRMALRFYADLLQRATESLEPNDASLTTIGEKTSLILKESGIVDDGVARNCLQVVANAEKALSPSNQIDVRTERRLLRIKENVANRRQQ